MFMSRLSLWTTEAQSCWGLLGGRVGLVSEWGHLRSEEVGAFVLQLLSALANGYLQGPSLPRTSCLLCLHSMSAPEKLSDGKWQQLAVGSHCMHWDGGCHRAWRGNSICYLRYSPLKLAFICPESGSSHMLLLLPGTFLCPTLSLPNTQSFFRSLPTNSVPERASLNPTILEQFPCQSHWIHAKFFFSKSCPVPMVHTCIFVLLFI